MHCKITFFLRRFILFLLLCISTFELCAWGFYTHRIINRTAVFTLPPEMLGFYKYHLQYLTENAINPDRRRYAVPEEGPRHYIDLDLYEEQLDSLPLYWSQAEEKFGYDSLMDMGIVPWHVQRVKVWLTQAFERKDAEAILRLSADIGHYIADAHVPLHTTSNYNGQKTGQRGIHAFWESRLPELFMDDYNLFVGKAEYLNHTQHAIWEAVKQAHRAVDSVLRFEKELSLRFTEDKKYVMEERGQSLVKTYSREFSQAYHQGLDGQVERQLRASIKMVGSFWLSAWVDAGQPDLSDLLDKKKEIKEEELPEKPSKDKLLFPLRPHEEH